MKKLFMCLGLVVTCHLVQAQEEKSTDVFSLATRYPWKITPGADLLMDCWEKLLERRGGGADCTLPNITTITAYMPVGYYQVGDSGNISFAAFLDERPEAGSYGKLRAIFNYSPGSYSFYGACVPSPLSWPIDSSTFTTNDVYEAYLVKTRDYRAATDKSYLALRPQAILSTDIISIDGYAIEGKEGYIAEKIPAQYNNPNSSLGLVVRVNTHSEGLIWCYLLNNYDGDPTITWKEPSLENSGGGDAARPVDTKEMYLSLSSAAILQNIPNPVLQFTTIQYMTPAHAKMVQLIITDYRQNIIRQINSLKPGEGTIKIDATGLQNGNYYYALVCDGIKTPARQMVVLH